MAQDISLLGAVYQSVPAVQLPKDGGGSALFADPSPVTASAADVLAGKYFLDSTGSITEGTGSGGGGGDDSATGIIERTISGAYTNSTASLVGNYAFHSCKSITNVNFTSANKISGSVFVNCTSLTTISFPEVTTIGAYAFSSCTSLLSAKFPLATSVGNYAFINCTSLATISFPAVVSIGNQTFSNCRYLESAYFLGSSVPTMGTGVFYATPMSTSAQLGHWGSIFVKESLLSSFKTKTNWSAYSARMVGLTDAQIEAL